MSYPLVNLAQIECNESPLFIEGAVYAANLATQPLEPEAWISEVFGEHAAALEPLIVAQIHAQYHQLKRSEYALLALLAESSMPREDALADFAEGFMSVWPQVESQWQSVTLSDGSMRMLQALLTTLMLAIDEEQTHAQMKAAGYDALPTLAAMIDQLDLMVQEVALAADEAMLGNKAQSVNPFKDIGRNDACPCGSGKKFKQCCGQ
ncbi:YecA family protein [Vibrio sp. Vb2880]|uniref:YecA/YgfB family protein n=1 Tax=Vibrio TaxID=662 RepID=UPI0001B93745|nr:MULTISPECIES: YecA family protein [Vibrio]ADT86723.1 SecA, C-motif domain protein [Vibrio furnissii NCTC 11218]EEX41325.1 protein export cytoplasm protein SecA ATPase RNA helicase [Vibrio furnissii CIP 102972]MBO0212246.1 YecA family protein [Vibrio sp. Vb2880]QDC93400.1 YecA family protein [Vibrio furnissii]UHJ59099.1 YecA family protein [Vibrio furnissii]